MNIDEAYKQYLIHIQLNEGMSRRTVASYRNDLNQYIAYLKEEEIEDTSDITYQIIQEFIGEQSLLKASSSVVHMAASIRSFHHDLSFMYDEKDPSLNLEVHKKKNVLPVYCTEEEIAKLMNSFNDDDAVDFLNHTVLELIYACGLRVSEAVSLTLNRIDLENERVRVLGKGDKERIVPIPHGCIALLKKYRDVIRPGFLNGRSSYFFLNRHGRKLTVRYVEYLLEEKNKQLGFDKHITPHKLRHSYATHMLAGGADLRSIQEILGHSNIQTTEIYTHVQNRHLFDSYDHFHPGNLNDDLEEK